MIAPLLLVTLVLASPPEALRLNASGDKDAARECFRKCLELKGDSAASLLARDELSKLGS